ncbi:MAG TPA: PDZ domain-containing protein [Vicinamibacterales bacterium]|nr:PDZ domain-containing protein [Vicinamibacterales bacterium]
MLKRIVVILFLITAVVVHAQPAPNGAIRYRLSFPEPQHRWMQVEALFPNVGSAALELRMSRSSPGRYSLHDFAKNVYDVHAIGTDGRELQLTRPDPYGWDVPTHTSDVTVRYKVFGDRVDGTYLAIDETHAHINMPAAIMWAHNLEDRPAALTFDPPAGKNWTVATQLHPQGIAFTAPNLQYLMDSPAEFGPVAMREFTIGDRRFRIAMHHTGTDAELDAFARDVEKIVRQEGAVYGEFPQYEPGYYTFLTDLLPWANGDGMEHRNSTVISMNATLATRRDQVLDTFAHEFFHCWNVERIRPKGLEPFDFDRANLSGELWLAEGFTQYYGPLALVRAGLNPVSNMTRDIGGLVDFVTTSPGRTYRSAEQMSQMAPFIDGGRPIDRTNWSNSVMSYYPFGSAIALALDLSLRDRTDSRLSLDDFMRAMWRKFGKPGGSREGYVDRPYTIADAEETLAGVSGDRAFAHDFFAKYIQGHEAADYPRLLARAGFVVRPRSGGRAWMGDLRYESRSGIHVTTLVSPTWPVYSAGLEMDDELKDVDGQTIAAEADVQTALAKHQPGDTIPITFVDRAGRSTTAKVTLATNPHVEVATIESAGGALTDAQRTFRQNWLGAKQSER